MMNMSRRIVEVFYRRREKSEDYFVRFDLKPNPLNYDGMDEVQAMVVRSDRISGNAVERVVLTSDPAEDFSTAEALADLARKAAELEGDSYLRDQKAPDSARLQVELNRTMRPRWSRTVSSWNKTRRPSGGTNRGFVRTGNELRTTGERPFRTT